MLFSLMLLDEILTLLVGWRNLHRAVPRTVPQESGRRVAVLIAAHQEGAVIADTVQHALAQDLGSHTCLVFVVADRCMDATAARARAAGAEVWERAAPCAVGKGYALAALLDWMGPRRDDFEAFVVIDADVQLDSGCLRALLSVHDQGYPVVQGRVRPRTMPGKLTATRMARVAHETWHVMQTGRMAMGQSVLIVGSCVLYSRACLASCQWTFAHYTPSDEDIRIPLVARDVRIGYAPEATGTEYAVGHLDALAHQRSRWLRNHLVLAMRAGLPMGLKALVQGQWRRAENVLAHFALSSHAVELMLAAGLTAVAWALSVPSLLTWALGLLLGKVAFSGALVRAAGASWSELARSGASLPWLMLGWVWGSLRLLRRPSCTSWTHTRHDGSPGPTHDPQRPSSDE